MKIYILIWGLLIISMSGKSQIIHSVYMNYGTSLSDLKWNYDENNSFVNYSYLGQKSINGFYSNLEIEYFENKYFALVSGLGFYQKGGADNLTNSPFKWNLDYLTFDTKLKAKYRYKNWSPYLLVGPRFDYLLKFSSEFNEYDQLATLNKINYGLRYGIGLQYYIDKFIVGIGWDNNFNLNSIVENDGKFIRPKFTIDDQTMIFKCEIGYVFFK